MSEAPEQKSEPWIYPLRFGQTLATNQWVEWHLHRFLGSRFVAHMLHQGRRDAIGTAAILWSESYREDPAGTLPDDDVVLARLAGYGVDVGAWTEMRLLALWGWSPVIIESADGAEQVAGRLGHRVIAEIAAKSAHRRDGRAAGREAGRLAVTKTRIRQKLISMGRTKFAENDGLVDEVARFLQASDLYVTPDNVAAALAALHGIPRVVDLSDRGAERGAGGRSK